MPHKIKVEAKEVSLAIEKGLRKLGLRRDQVEVTVLENPRKGFLGIGARPAVVELRQKRWTSGNLDAQIYMDVPKKKRSSGGRGGRGNGRNSSRGRKNEGGVREIKRGGRRAYGSHSAEKAPRMNETQLLPSLEIQNTVVPEYLKAPLQEAKDFLHNVLSHMGVKEENLNAWWDEKQHRILLTFDCDHPAIVIGKEGKTLESLQYLATLSLSRHFDKPISVIADTQNYWRKMEDKINSDIEHGINQIKNGYSVYRFRPMSAQLRRYIHRAVENNEFVITVSEGEDQWRKVTLRPRPADMPVKKTAEAVVAAVAVETMTETVAEVAPSAEVPAVEATAHTEPVLDNTEGASCQAEMACNCAENETQVGCGCENNVQSQTENPALAENPVVETVESAPAVETVAEVPPQEPAQEVAPVTEEAPAQSEVIAEAIAEPALAVEILAESAVAAEPVQDNADGGTCQAEIARNCAENEQEVGCACGPLFESVEQAAEAPVQAEPAPVENTENAAQN